MTGPRLPWRVATVTATHRETAAARTIQFDVPGWPGHLAGQHVDVRLTAEDGYSTQRSYSIAAPRNHQRVELTVQRVPNGEVSSYLVGSLVVGDQIELRGPVGGWFVWRPEEAASIMLIAGGSGVVPLMTMVRDRAHTQSVAPFRLLYSVRSPAEMYYRDELDRRARDDRGLDVSVLYTRSVSPATTRAPGRIGRDDLVADGRSVGDGARTYVCGPTAFVEAVVTLLLAEKHDPSTIRTERFGPSGG